MSNMHRTILSNYVEKGALLLLSISPDYFISSFRDSNLYIHLLIFIFGGAYFNKKICYPSSSLVNFYHGNDRQEKRRGAIMRSSGERR